MHITTYDTTVPHHVPKFHEVPNQAIEVIKAEIALISGAIRTDVTEFFVEWICEFISERYAVTVRIGPGGGNVRLEHLSYFDGSLGLTQATKTLATIEAIIAKHSLVSNDASDPAALESVE